MLAVVLVLARKAASVKVDAPIIDAPPVSWSAVTITSVSGLTVAKSLAT